MTLEQNKVLARRLIQAFDDEDFDAMGELLSVNFRYHQNGKVEEGADGFRAMMKRVYAAWQPHRLEIEDEIAEGDRVVFRMIAYDTHSGPYRGLPATAAELTWSLIFIFRIARGRIAEIWRAGDDVVRFEQVGLEVVPKSTVAPRRPSPGSESESKATAGRRGRSAPSSTERKMPTQS